MSIETHLGKAIVEGGMALVEQDAKTYGSPVDVVMSKARVHELVDYLAARSGADAVRRMTAHKLGECLVGILHSADHQAVLSRAMADIVSVAPVVDLVNRAKEEAERKAKADEFERQIQNGSDQGREPADGAAFGKLGMAAE